MRIDTTVRHQTHQNMLRLRAMLRRGEKLPTQVAIPDIHGAFEPLRKMLATTQVEKADKVIFMGDYFDRAVGAKDVFNRLVSLNEKDQKYVFLLGNHELNMLLALKGSSLDFLWWLGNGGLLQVKEHIYGQIFFAAIDKERTNPKCQDLQTVINRVFTEHREVFDAGLQAVRKNKYFLEVFNWLIRNCQLFHVDALGTLYLHAGVDFNGRLGVNDLDHLAEYGRDFFESVESNEEDSLVAAQEGVRRFRKNMDMRPKQWLGGLAEEETVREALFRWGIRSLVYGHEPQDGVAMCGQRIFGIDLKNRNGSNGGVYRGCGGFLEMGEDGVVCYQFDGISSMQLQRCVLVPPEEFKAMLLADAERLIEGWQSTH